jgi:hypothetical protein
MQIAEVSIFPSYYAGSDGRSSYFSFAPLAGFIFQGISHDLLSPRYTKILSLAESSRFLRFKLLNRNAKLLGLVVLVLLLKFPVNVVTQQP